MKNINPIQKLIQSEVNCLVEKSNGFDIIKHNVTKGSLRETLLIDFFKKLIPSSLSISSGIICDGAGESSTQTDFIVYDKEVLPSLMLDKDLAIIPIETVYLTAEIKSTLRAKDLEQVSTARNKFNTLKLSTTNTETFKVPSVIIAFDSDVSEKKLTEWLKKQNDVVSICIINKFLLSNTFKGIECFTNEDNLSEHWATLNFSLQMFNYLGDTFKKRKVTPLWGAYVQGVDKFKELNGIE